MATTIHFDAGSVESGSLLFSIQVTGSECLLDSATHLV